MSVIQKAARVAQETKKKQRRSYLGELKEEMKKVSWTTREELTTCTKIVLGSIFFLGLGIYIVDLLLKGSVDGLHLLVKLVTG